MFDPYHSQTTVELAVGKNLSVDELQAWKSGFERDKSGSGYRIVGFRQQSDSLLIAIIARSN
ncbi:hypothetical protein [Novosphingobium album (ex Hu et al. 2023)]|uniref:DUF4258 domain-containing protein n=1 Tax=Novosphingobium album (ex Hu et al. 2023) TaxID=2930093 RepID=A0ABT0B6M9_9SPHN|nr:hypothetical protein [Novosphingobium album (ex Hu et al. 2023)]MCJ2180694.1 hypothetical protein [Novosphingobium album (ex Hu et al. 2023)]